MLQETKWKTSSVSNEFDIDSLMQKKCNSIANAVELHPFNIKLSIYLL